MTRTTFLLGAALLIGWEAGAQPEAPPEDVNAREVNSSVQFNFLNPGARSLGLGGAFIARADDATAAFTNPAGLTVLPKPEVAIEGRRFGFSHVFLDGGRTLDSAPTWIGVDRVSGLVNGVAESTTSGLSFLSFVYPADRWAVTVYRREAANFEVGFETQGAFVTESDGTLYRLFPVTTSIDLKIVDVGVAGAVKLGKGLSLGLGLSLYDFSLSSVTKRYNLRSDPKIDALPGFFLGPPLIQDGNLRRVETQEGDDTDFALSVGFLWMVNEKWNIGGVYRRGPDFDFTTGIKNLVALRSSPSPRPALFHVPDVYGLGFSLRPAQGVTVSFDYNRVYYSQLAERFVPTVDRVLPDYKVDDANEFHLGFEYAFRRLFYPVVLRLGTWSDPDHRLRYDGSDRVERASLPEGQDQFHYAGGVGLVFGQRVQVDMAVDYSPRITTVSVSTVIRF